MPSAFRFKLFYQFQPSQYQEFGGFSFFLGATTENHSLFKRSYDTV